MRTATLIVLSFVVSGSAYALAQGQPAVQERAAGGADSPSLEAPEEVIVRGRRLTELRFNVQEARERAYNVFNEINTDDDFDVHCRYERKYHSRAKKWVCAAQFEDRITADAGAEYMRTLKWICPPSPVGAANIQDCIFSGHGQMAANAARRVEGQAPPMRDRMDDEIVRLANENDEFAQAILDWYEADLRYDEARGRGED
jgi:hypothetical protein